MYNELIVLVFLTWGVVRGAENLNCYTKWISGYRLSSGRPKEIIDSVSLKTCEQECIKSAGCAAFAFRNSGSGNGTCELATTNFLQNDGRDSRSLENNTITLNELDSAPPYDVYMQLSGKDENCLKRSPLFYSHPKIDGSVVPIDCFYRLMSGKRLGEKHALKSISVNSLQECQEVCITEKSFNCRSVSYRLKPSGFSYSVRNCQLSPYFLSDFHGAYPTDLISKSDLIEDFEYNYFQKETFCRDTGTSTFGHTSYGVCSAIISSGRRMRQSVVKSSHQVSSASQCEHLCATSLFRCRAFAFRHTTRGHLSSERDRYNERSLMSSCLLTEADLSQLQAYNIEPDPDYDLYEMGRQVDSQCVLHDRFQSFTKAPNTMDLTYNRYPEPLTSASNYYPVYNRPMQRDDRFPLPSTSYGSTSTSYWNRPYDRNNYHPLEVCLVQFRADAYLLPEASQATFPVKTLEECKIECLRSDKVLKITCRVMAFRVTSQSGGMCQISEVESRSLHERDFIPARDHYERAIIFYYDERERSCLRPTTTGRYDERPIGGYPAGYQHYDRYPVDSRYDSRRYDSYYQYGRPYDRYADSRYPPQGLSVVGGPSYTTYPVVSSKGYYDYGHDELYGGGRYAGRGSAYPGYPSTGMNSYGMSGYYGQGGWTTVDGEPCQHSCVMNKEVGFYYCQIGRDGSWNFCCRPDEGGQCGSSRGLSFSWCYVGTGASQNSWRTCSPNQSYRMQKDLDPYKGHTVAYLHEAQPPAIHTITNVNDIANLTRDDAVVLFNQTMQ